jgi:Fe-S cluster assembly protein SufD
MSSINLIKDFEKLREFASKSSLKKSAFERLSKLKLPTKKSEEYRYFDIEPLLERTWKLIRSSSAKEIKSGDRVVISDGVVTQIPKDIEVGCTNTISLTKEHFDPLYYLSHLLAGDVIALRIKADSKITIEHHFSQPDSLLAYRVAIFVDSNVNVTINEKFVSKDAKSSLILFGYDIFLSRDSNLELIKSQTLNKESFIPIASHRFKVDENSTFDWKSFDFGEGSGLELGFASLHKYSTINSNHLIFAKDEAKRGVVTKYNHIGEHSKSNQLSKTILQDRARGIFDALIKVENSAKYTVAHQNSKAILLNDGAYMASKPQLEIYIDELEASHGSTTGQLDERALFYLRSRGINLQEAKKMLILAFANELIESIKDEKVKNLIHQDFEIFYYGSSEVECLKTCHNCEEMILS